MWSLAVIFVGNWYLYSFSSLPCNFSTESALLWCIIWLVLLREVQWSVFVFVAPTWESAQDKSTFGITSAIAPITTLPNSITCIKHLRKQTGKLANKIYCREIVGNRTGLYFGCKLVALWLMSTPWMQRLLHHLFIMQSLADDDGDEARPLAESLLLAIADLLFCPGFTAQSNKKNSSVS